MIDPHIDGFLTAIAAKGFAMPAPPTPQALRTILDVPRRGVVPDIARQRDVVIETDGGLLAGRLYHSSAREILPVIIFFHGGGWVHGTLDMYDRLCVILAVQSHCAVISVDYRLAPENPFPAAWDDALASVQWVKDSHVELCIDASRMALAGDSAGGNLAAAAAQALANDTAILHQLLLYPALDSRCQSVSFNQDYAGFFTAEQMRWYWKQYAPGALRFDKRVSPALAPIASNLAPATIIVAGHDPLYDEGVAYAAALKAAGVASVLHDYPGGVHGFISLFGAFPLADEAILTASSALRSALYPV